MSNMVPASSLNRANRATAPAAEKVKDLKGRVVGDRVVDPLSVPEGYATYHVAEVGPKKARRKVGGYKVELPEGRSLAWYDILAINSSAGKDSIAQLWKLYQDAKSLGIEDRIIVVHCDLGEPEWPDTAAYVKAQADVLGVPWVVVSRIGTVSGGVSKMNDDTGRKNPPLYEKGAARGDILDQVIARYAQFQAIAAELEADGKPELAAKWADKVAWPDAQNRWCTKDHKTGPAYVLYTSLANAWREANPEADRPCRILNALGIRGQESGKRAVKPDFVHEKKSSSKNKHIDTWHPIKWWTHDKVWAAIKESGMPHHWAYDLGMPRLSCAFCVLANKASLMIAGKVLPEKLDQYVAVEAAVGKTFQMGSGNWDGSLAEIKAAIAAGEEAGETEEWAD